MMYVTLYQRLTAHYEATNSTPLNVSQKSDLGRKVAKAWYNSENQKKDSILETKSAEEDGLYKVFSYPQYFIPQIDQLIKEYYTSLRPKKIRKRIPLNRSFTAKPNNP